MRAILAVFAFLSVFSVGAALGGDEAPFTVLLVADSHGVGTWGRRLDADFRSIKGAVVRTYASCGSSVASWLKGLDTNCGYLERVQSGDKIRHFEIKHSPTPLLSSLLAKESINKGSSFTFIALGANMIEPLTKGAKSVEAVKRSVEDALALIGRSGTTCVWIGPPHMRRFGNQVDLVYRMLAPILKGDGEEPRCQLVDSRKFSKYPAKGGDGIHYDFPAGKASAEAWADAIFAEARKVIGR